MQVFVHLIEKENFANIKSNISFSFLCCVLCVSTKLPLENWRKDVEQTERKLKDWNSCMPIKL